MLTGLFGRREAGTVDDVMQFTGPILGVAFVVTGLGALTAALLALTRERDRSWVVWLALVFGVLGVMFLLGELLLPH